MLASPALTPFENAVAGSTPFLFAHDFPGKVFKPALPREKTFYDSLAKHTSLQKLVPKYYGTLPIKSSPIESEGSLSNELRDTPSEYLVLEDLTHDFVHPCILDVKLGITHHDIDEQNPRAQPLRSSKYLTTPLLGFCLTGMQVYKANLSKFEYMDKGEGRNLTDKTIEGKLSYFFHNGLQMRDDVVVLLLQKLQLVAKYFENEPSYQFRSTSLLLIYEGKPGLEPRVDARMIDFAHANQITSRKFKDVYGYLFGTRNLMRFMENILKPNLALL